MVYLKILILLVGLLFLGLVSIPIVSVYLLLLLWVLLSSVLWLIAIFPLGIRKAVNFLKALSTIFLIWTGMAFGMALFLAGDTPFLEWGLLYGPVKAFRFSTALLFAAIIIPYITPGEIYGASLIPIPLRHFILLFRAFISRFNRILSDALDQLHIIGFPPLSIIMKSFFSNKYPYPTHTIYSYSITKRITVSASMFLELIFYFLDRIITAEIPEMEYSFEKLLSNEEA